MNTQDHEPIRPLCTIINGDNAYAFALAFRKNNIPDLPPTTRSIYRGLDLVLFRSKIVDTSSSSTSNNPSFPRTFWDVSRTLSAAEDDLVNMLLLPPLRDADGNILSSYYPDLSTDFDQYLQLLTGRLSFTCAVDPERGTVALHGTAPAPWFSTFGNKEVVFELGIWRTHFEAALVAAKEDSDAVRVMYPLEPAPKDTPRSPLSLDDTPYSNRSVIFPIPTTSPPAWAEGAGAGSWARTVFDSTKGQLSFEILNRVQFPNSLSPAQTLNETQFGKDLLFAQSNGILYTFGTRSNDHVLTTLNLAYEGADPTSITATLDKSFATTAFTNVGNGCDFTAANKDIAITAINNNVYIMCKDNTNVAQILIHNGTAFDPLFTVQLTAQMHWPYTLLVTSPTADTLDISKTATPPVNPSASPSPVNILRIQADYGYLATINLDTRSLIQFDTVGLTSPEYSQYPYNDNYSASALLAGSGDTISSSPLSAGGIAGVVVGSLAVVALGVVAVVAGVRRRRRQQQGQQGNDVELESAPVDQTLEATTTTAPAEITSARPGEAESRA